MMNLYSHFSATGKKLEPFPFNVELAMEGYIVENPDVLKLDEEEEIEIIEIEQKWKKGESGEGRIDLLAVYKKSTYAIIELKKDIIDEKAFEQLKSYFNDEKHLNAVAFSLSKEFELDSKDSVKPKWRGVLVGSETELGLKEKIEKYNSNKKTIPFSVIELNRHKCDNQIYTLTNIVVRPKNYRDYSKYKYNNQDYCKNRLVLAIVKDYINKNSSCTLEQLRNVFPKNIQGSYCVVEEYSTAVEIAGRSIKRHFIDDAINLQSGEKIVVCDDWSISSIGKFIKKAEELGYKIS